MLSFRERDRFRTLIFARFVAQATAMPPGSTPRAFAKGFAKSTPAGAIRERWIPGS